MSEYRIDRCDFCDADHLTALAELLLEHRQNTTTEPVNHNKLQQLRLVDGLANHPSAIVLFVRCEEAFVGLAVGFVHFSTRHVKPYLHVQDLVVHTDHREMELEQIMLEALLEEATAHDWGMLALEVQEGNSATQNTGAQLGFSETYPRTLLWTKTL